MPVFLPQIHALEKALPVHNKRDGVRQASQLLLQLIEQPNLSLEQRMQILEALYQHSSSGSEEWRQASQLLLQLIEQPDLSFEQTLHVAEFLIQKSLNNLYQSDRSSHLLRGWLSRTQTSVVVGTSAVVIPIANWSSAFSSFVVDTFTETTSKKSEEQRQVAQLLLKLAQQPNLSFKQALQAARTLYENAPIYSEEELVALRLLWRLVQRQSISIERRLQVATIPLSIFKREKSYLAMAEAVQMILSLIPVELAKKYLSQKWPPLLFFQYQIIADHSYKVTALDIPYIIELANQETLPVSIRDEMY